MSSNAVRSESEPARPSPVIRSAMPLKRKSIGRCNFGYPADGGACRVGHLRPRAGSPSRPAYMTAARASRYVSRARSSSRVSSCLAALSNCAVESTRRGASGPPPRLRANSIWARSRAALARWRSGNGASSAIARSSYAAAGAAASRLACAAASALAPRWAGSDCQGGGPLQKRCRRGDSAPPLCPACRSFQLRGHRIVGPGGGVGGVPCPAVGVGLRIGRVGQRPMDCPAFGQIGRAIGG